MEFDEKEVGLMLAGLRLLQRQWNVTTGTGIIPSAIWKILSDTNVSITAGDIDPDRVAELRARATTWTV